MITLSFVGQYLQMSEPNGSKTTFKIERYHPLGDSSGILVHHFDKTTALKWASCSSDGVTAFASLAALQAWLDAGIAAAVIKVDTVDITGTIDFSGGIPIKDGATSQKATIDSTGALKVTGGASSVSGEYLSPGDFTATYTSSSTLTLTGLPFTLVSGAQIVYIKVRNTSNNLTATYVNGANGYGIGYSAGVVTLYLNGVASAVFTTNDMYEVGINSQQKAYDTNGDLLKTADQSPLSAKYVQDSLVDTTNITAATNYYPSITGMSMDGFKDLSLTGKIIEGDAVTDTIEVEATNDEDTTNADWVKVYGFDSKGNAMINQITTGGVAGTYTFAWDFDNFNYSYFRVKLVTADSTNTVIIKARRKAL
jgi:hypothetical protein